VPIDRSNASIQGDPAIRPVTRFVHPRDMKSPRLDATVRRSPS
jgi:hypothetical protein